MSISVTAKDQPTLWEITFVMSFAIEGKEGWCSKSHANPYGTVMSEIPGTLYVMLF